jgi:glycerol-3-phosphate cytidylyltransferase
MKDELPEIGVIAGNFDVIHPGYVKMFMEMREHSNSQFILLHDDPTIERPEKLKPVLSVEERKEIIQHFFVFPTILSYNTEEELKFLLKSINPDVRFLGEDYIDKSYTGDDLGIPVHWISRSHGWSTTKFKKLIASTL